MLCGTESLCVCVYLWWPFRDGFVAQGLKGFHGSVMSCCLPGPTLTNKLMTSHRELNVEDLRNGIMVPVTNKTIETAYKDNDKEVL